MLLLSALAYFVQFYVFNNSDFYIELTKGIVFPKNPIASASPLFYR